MRRRLMLRSSAGVSPVLPAEYQQVEWIGSPSINDYIITDIPTSANGILYASFLRVAKQQFSLGNAAGDSYIGFNIYNDLNKRYAVYPNAIKIGDYTNEQFELRVELNNGQANGVGNNYQFNVNYNVGDNTPYSIFRCSAFLNAPNKDAILRSLIFEVDGGITHNFVPCYRKADGEIGLYNTGNNVFYTNVGTGTFTKGADV